VDPSWKGIIKWGGLFLVAAGAILVIFILIVFISQQTLPFPPKEVLENPVVPTTLFLLAALGELFLMPAALGLYFSLKNVKNPHVYSHRIVVGSCTRVPCLPRPNHIPLANKR